MQNAAIAGLQKHLAEAKRDEQSANNAVLEAERALELAQKVHAARVVATKQIDDGLKTLSAIISPEVEVEVLV